MVPGIFCLREGSLRYSCPIGIQPTFLVLLFFRWRALIGLNLQKFQAYALKVASSTS